MRDWEIELEEFWLKKHSKMLQICSADNFVFCIFQIALWIYELLWDTKFCYSNIILKRSFNLQNTNFLRLILPQINFSVFLADFLKFCPQNLWHFEDDPIKYQIQCLLYNKFICSRVCAKNSGLNFTCLMCIQASKIWMIFWKIYFGVSLEIIFS